MKSKSENKPISSWLSNLCWNAWCCLSIVGIWPRFIEPKLIKKNFLKIKLPHLSPDLQDVKIAQFSDLHIHPKVSDRFLKKIIHKIEASKPDIICFTGDFLCFAQNNDLDRLEKFLQALHAPYGCYAILGNHDYGEFISINENGEYDILNASAGSFSRIFKRLWTSTILACKRTEKAKAVKHHAALEKLLKRTPFKLLKNESILLQIKNTFLNLTGLEEYVTGHYDVAKAFQNFDTCYPGIVLAHNPDSIPTLLEYPGEIILSGHTHGGQVNLPWLWKKFTLMENPHLKKGLFHIHKKWIYINRGVGSVMQFRWFAIPEILFLTLEAK